MRFNRLAFVFLAFYFVFLGGSAYYALLFPIRIFHHVLVTILLALWLIGRIRSKRGLPYTPLNKPIYALVVVWVVSALTSIDPRMAFENLWLQMIHVVLFFALVDLFQRGYQRLVMETQFLLAALIVFVTGLELASWYFGLGFTPGTDVGWFDVIGPGRWLPLALPRVSLAMNVSTLLAGYVAPLIPLTIGWALTTRRRDYRVVLRTLAVLLAVILLLTVSRGGIVSAIAGVGALVVMRAAQSQQVTRRINIRLLTGILIVGAVAVVTLFVAFNVIQSRRSGDLGRLDMWESAVKITRDYPLTGVGPGLYGRAFRSHRDPALARDKLASAHNIALNTAAETGLAGLAVSAWLGIAFVFAWWRTWQQATTSGRKLRLEATFAALIGVGIHSTVDLFTTTPLVLLILLLAAYSITGHRSRLDTPPPGHRLPALIALVMVVGYGIWLIQLDRAQALYQRSLSGSETALDDARAAHDLDPHLNLYTLQIAFLSGQQIENETDADLSSAIEAYETALELEPTWDTGWINLAALVARQGNIDLALTYLQQAWDINTLNTAPLHWARLSEDAGTADDDSIIAAYLTGMRYDNMKMTIPLSEFWTETRLRTLAMERYVERMRVDWRYRVLVIHEPETAYTLVPETPENAYEWWVTGEYALTVENDAETAIRAFSNAIKRSRTEGDYYVSRARAELTVNPDAAQTDLNIAQLLGTRFEYPNAVRALLATQPDEANALRARALPSRSVGQEFSAVLYGRVASFDVFPEMRAPGPGRTAMQPWYDIAAQDIANGHIEAAIDVYRAILDYAPYETEAQTILDELEMDSAPMDSS